MGGETSAASQRFLSKQAALILKMIAAGLSYEQIVATIPGVTYGQIFDAAAEALSTTFVRPEASHHMARLKARYARAYEKWTPEEEDDLRQLLRQGHTVARIAGRLKRNRGAIRARIVRLGLVDRLSLKEQGRLRRIMDREWKRGM